MFKNTIALLLITSMAIATAAGCGDDDSSAEADTIETSSMSKAQFVKQVQKICVKGNEDNAEELGAYIEENEGPKSEGELYADAFREILVPKIESQLEEIEDLGAPKGDEALIETFLAAQRAGAVALEDARTLNIATGFDKPFSKGGDIARQYGITECAYDPA